MEISEEHWISGYRKDGRIALYNTNVEIDENALEGYWTNIRRMTESVGRRKFRPQATTKIWLKSLSVSIRFKEDNAQRWKSHEK